MIQGWEHLVITLCIIFIARYLIKNTKKGKAQDERIQRPIGQLDDWDDYLAKLCRITGKNAHDLMLIAAQESGLNYDKNRVNKDFRRFIGTGELPYYVTRFLEKGKEKIESIDEGPIPKNQNPWII